MATNKQELFQQFSNIVVEQLGVHLEQVTKEASFVDDLGADSLDCVELIMSCEEAFGLSIPEEDCDDLKTVQDTVDYLAKRLDIKE